MKIAVYVEGQAELIFVRELLLKWFQYDSARIGLKCYNLHGEEPPGHETDYSFGNPDSENYYIIINVGNDASVLSKALDNAQRHKNTGFTRIVALRDMYCDNYHRFAYDAGKPRTIISELNNRFINGARESIDRKSHSCFVYICFAIMEIEAWLLGMGWFLERIDSRLSQNFLKDTIGYDLDKDVETTEYHPACMLDNIYKTIGLRYDKHSSDVNSIMGNLDLSDFQMLLCMPKCDSFKRFVACLTEATAE